MEDGNFETENKLQVCKRMEADGEYHQIIHSGSDGRPLMAMEQAES